MFDIPIYINFILETIEKAGYEAYLVGGCVRDLLRGYEPNDWDIASSASPYSIMELFESTFPSGLKYGTVTVFVGKNKAEVTTFRTEGKYCDSRRPDEVNFVSDIKSDLSRRDFTINAIAYNPKKGLIDPFNGQQDIKNKVIRTVNLPDQRFDEDALRILRALRFKAKLSFEIEKNTLNSIKALSKNVSLISGERVKTELDKILISASPDVIFDVVDLKILDYLLVDTDCFERNNNSKIINDFGIGAAWAQLFYFQKNLSANKTFSTLHFSKELRQEVMFYLFGLNEKLPNDKIELKHKLSKLIDAKKYINIIELRKKLFNEDNEKLLKDYHEVFDNDEPFNLKMINITGKDLATLKIEEGRKVGDILNKLLLKIIENPSLNDKNLLLKMADSYYHHH